MELLYSYPCAEWLQNGDILPALNKIWNYGRIFTEDRSRINPVYNHPVGTTFLCISSPVHSEEQPYDP